MPHIHEKIDYTVEVFIVHKNKVLLRMHDKFKIWLSVGGHIELDEDPLEAAFREVKEEVGLAITIVDHTKSPSESDGHYHYITPPRYMGKHFVNDIHQHVVFVYFARVDSDITTDSVLPHEQGAELRWVTREQLATMELVPNVQFYATAALDALASDN